ncbi:hypothetical protein FNF31_03584 [Cafeteria roenbergensis]|uniref:Uncharacterized protein n=1 Tax=Cafeteria roenbergensis TaxID=33653 RepID=A0A5A8D9B3_CAFRO|nr:hypothetical protein FNF31_03584 [Cafeteria roenbergensis]
MEARYVNKRQARQSSYGTHSPGPVYSPQSDFGVVPPLPESHFLMRTSPLLRLGIGTAAEAHIQLKRQGAANDPSILDLDPRERLHRLPARWQAPPTRRRMDDTGRFTSRTAGQDALERRRRWLARIREAEPSAARGQDDGSTVAGSMYDRPASSAASYFSISSRPGSRLSHFATTTADDASLAGVDETLFAEGGGGSATSPLRFGPPSPPLTTRRSRHRDGLRGR